MNIQHKSYPINPLPLKLIKLNNIKDITLNFRNDLINEDLNIKYIILNIELVTKSNNIKDTKDKIYSIICDNYKTNIFLKSNRFLFVEINENFRLIKKYEHLKNQIFGN